MGGQDRSNTTWEKGRLHDVDHRIQVIEFRGVGTLRKQKIKKGSLEGESFFIFSLVKACLIDNVSALIYEK